MKKSLLLIPFLAASAWSYDPYRDQHQQQSSKQDPEQFTRPVTNTLKGADIKEFRDKMNAAKAQVFKNPSAEGSSRFRTQTEDIGGKFQAEGPLSHFTEPVQAQILSKTPEAKNSAQNILVDVTIDGKTVTVDSAKMSDVKLARPSAVMPAKSEVASVNVPGPQAPKTVEVKNAARIITTPAAAQPANAVTSVKKETGLSVEAQRAKTESPTRPPSNVAGKTFGDDGLAKPVVRMEITQIAKNLASDTGAIVKSPQVAPTLVPAAALPANVPAAIIPVAEGSPLIVTTVKESKAGSPMIMEVRGPADDLPPAITDQIKKDLPKASKELPKAGLVAVTMTVKPSGDVSVTSVKQVKPADSMAKPVVSDLKTTSTPRLLEAAKSIAVFLGADPANVVIQNPPGASEQKTPAVAVVSLTNRGEIMVREVSVDPATAAPIYRAEAKFSDLSAETREKILGRLSEFGSDGVIKPDTKVEFDFAMLSNDQKEVTQVSIKTNETTKLVLLYKETNTSTKASEFKGLMPVIARVMQSGFGYEKGQYSGKDFNSKGMIRFTGQKGAGTERKTVTLNWAPMNGAAAPTVFTTENRPPNFSDEIREAIYAKLREMVQNGETWATEALKGNKEVAVELKVSEDGQKVELQSVSQTSKDAAVDLAHSLELQDGEFLIAQVGDQTLVAINQSHAALIKFGDKTLKLESPDAGAKIFVKKNRAKEDIAVTLLLSRESLEKNREGILNVAGKESAPIIDQALAKEPKQKEFVLKIDPATTEKLVIK